jgi:predicted  nucleic acid-binding Zn-ribbon protein
LEKKLRNLFALQMIDSHLDELEEMKGDLPGEVRTLEGQLTELQERLASLEEEMRGAFVSRDDADSQILGLKEKLETYRQQQYAVRNNREYDALTREMDAATSSIARLEKEMEEFENRATVARTTIESTKAGIDAVLGTLKEKRTALAEVSKATEEEELRFQHEREKIVVRLNKADIVTYERIRRAKQGKAVVAVKRGACGGCFNRVPPQRLLELRQNAKIHTCERCGRILVSDEIVESAARVD